MKKFLILFGGTIYGRNCTCGVYKTSKVYIIVKMYENIKSCLN